jgi:uncharacterized repeat protein (TIGR01451 family)
VSVAPGPRNVTAPGAARIWLAESQPLSVVHVGPGASRLAAGAQPLSMISADLENRGIPGLLVGYSTPNGGVVVWHRGNIDAYAPQSDASFQAIANSQFPSTFLPEAQTFNVPVSPDFIAVGDFTGRGQQDLAVAARGGSAVYIFSGDGKGHFTSSQTINAPGGVTALVAERFGKLNSALLVGASAPKQSFLAVYAPGAHGLASLASLPLHAPALNVLFGEFGDLGPDAAFLSGGQLFILRSSNMKLVNVALPVSASAFALGSFLFDRNGGSQIAVLGVDGSVQVAVRNEFDPRTYTNEEFRAIRQARLRGETPPLVPAHSFAGNGWRIVEGFASLGSVTPGQTPMFFRTRISVNGADDIMWLGAGRGQMVLISHSNQLPGAATFLPGQVSVKSYNGSPVRALPMRTNADGRLGIVALHQGQTAPAISAPIPDPVFTVNRTDDPTPVAPITNACNGVANDCSLREAILRANGDTVMVPAGTYTLTIAKVANDCTGNFGALSAENSVTIIGSVDGSGNPTSIIQAGTTSYNPGPANGVDMVMNVNEDLGTASCPVTSATASLSNLVLQNGHNLGTHGNDGDGGCMEFDTGASGTATLTLTNVTLQNCDTTQGSGGGLANFNFVVPTGSGHATITNSVIQGNSVTDNSAPGPNTAGGGGIWVTDSSQLIMSNTKVLNNLATQTSGGAGPGGGLFIISVGTPGQTPTTQIHSSTISGNQSSIQGGGIFDSANLVIDSGTVISGNKNGQNGGGPTDGGGLFINPAVGNSAALSKVTIINNQSTGTGGGIATGAVGAGSVSINFSRVTGNTAATTGSNLQNLGSTVNATNSWWGTNSPSGTIATASGTTTFDPFIVLNHTASPGKIRINQSSTLTADMSRDNHGVGAALSGNLDEIVGLPVTFNNAVLGSIAETQPETLGNPVPTATATYNAGSVGGNGSADATVDQQTVTASITVLQPPSITKSFGPKVIQTTSGSGTTASTITFSITNGNTVAIDSSFTDNLPANLVVATTPNVINNCGGTVTAAAGASTISFANPTLAVGTCTVQVNVQSAVDNNYSNSVTINSADAGNGNTSSDTLTVINPPHIAKAFGASSVPLNGTTSLTFTVSSSNANLTLSGVAFTDALPAGLVVASTPNLNNTCGGTATATAGATSVSLSGASQAPGASCTVSLNVQGTSAAVDINSVQVTSTNAGTGNTATATLTVVAPQGILKAFSATSIPLNGSTSLSFTINNPNSTVALSGVAFTDTLPAGLIISTPNGLVGSCGGGIIIAAAGTSTINLSGGTLAAGGSCSFAVSVTGTAAGQQNNTTGAVTSNEGGTGGTASASIVVVGPPAAAKAFNPSGIQPGGTSTLTITITNPAANAQSLTGLAFTDNFPTNLVVATPGSLTNTCGGTASAPDGSASFSLTGGTVAANSSCAVSVNVTSAFTGSYPNTTGPVSSNEGGAGNAASATLNVAFPPTISKLFLPSTITAGSTTLLSFTISNPNSNSTPPSNDMTLTGIQFTDTLPAGVVVASPNQLSNNCDGTVTAIPGTGVITLTGGDLGAAVQLRKRGAKTMSSPGAGGVKLMQQPSSNGSCFVSVEVTAAAAGTYNNTTGPISANESGPGVASNTATLTVQAAPIVSPPTVSKAFGVPSFALNGTTTLTFNIANPNPQPLVNILLNDPLPAGLVVANPNGLTDVPPGAGCQADSAVVFANPGSHSINMVGLVLLANTSCSYSVNVTGVTSGNWVNTTMPITATFNDGSDNFVGITGGSATASVVVELPPSISKAFNPALIANNGVSTLIFTITNPSVNLVAETGVAFTDTLPSPLVVASPSGATGNCNGGTFTAVAGTNSISLTGGSIPVNSSCVLSVNVTGAVTSTVTNTTGPVSSTNGGTGNTASATLSIKPANLSITKTHQGAFNRGSTGTYTITVSDAATAGPTLGTVTVKDTLPKVEHTFIPVSMSGTGWTCTLSTLTCTRSDVLAPGASYPSITLTVSVPQNIQSPVTNSATVSGGGDPNSHTANDDTKIQPPLSISQPGPGLSSANMTVPAGGSGSFMFDLASTEGLGTVTFSCSGLPTGAACSFNPPQTDELSAVVTMTITVPPHPASASAWPLAPGRTTYALFFPALGLLGIVFLGGKKAGKKSWKLRLLGLAGTAMLLALVSCGGGSQGMTPPPQPLTNYQVTVTASAGAVTSSTTITLSVR